MKKLTDNRDGFPYTVEELYSVTEHILSKYDVSYRCDYSKEDVTQDLVISGLVVLDTRIRSKNKRSLYPKGRQHRGIQSSLRGIIPFLNRLSRKEEELQKYADIIDRPNYDLQLFRKTLREKLRLKFSIRDVDIFFKYYGVGGSSYTFEELGCKYSLTRARTQQICSDAFEYLVRSAERDPEFTYESFLL